MKIARTLVAVLLIAGLAGCLDDEPQGVTGASGPIDDWAAYGVTKRIDGNVTTEEEDGGWVARQHVSFTNGAGNATAMETTLLTRDGDISVVGWTNGSFQLDVDLWARAGSTDQARRTLENLHIVYADDMEGDRLAMGATIQARPGLLDILDLFVRSPGQYGATMRLHVPSDLFHELTLVTTNGGISAGGVSGGRLEATTANGPVAVLGNWDDLSLETYNGPVVVRTESKARTGVYRLSTSNGPIDLSVNDGPDHGFDLTADTSNAPILIDLRDLDELSDEHERHVRTRGYADKAMRTEVELATSNGPVTVTGRG